MLIFYFEGLVLCATKVFSPGNIISRRYTISKPDVVKNAAAPLEKVDRITMYGDGNNTKLIKDIMNTVNQVTDGLKESTGVDLSAVLSGFLAGKAMEKSEPVNVNIVTKDEM